MPGIILRRLPDSTLTAYLNKTPTIHFAITSDLSRELTTLLDNAPSFSWEDTVYWPPSGAGKPRVVKAKGRRFTAAIDLDYLPPGVARPQLKLVRTAQVPAPRVVKVQKPARKTVAPVTKKTKTKKTTAPTETMRKAAPVTGRRTEVVTSLALAPARMPTATAGVEAARTAGKTAAAARPKGLEIDMVPGTFVAAGDRSSRLKKRPARYD
ncbi:MAG: hypothetical protein L6R39_003729 [Caloplaca ligustica]|nr:MAG: hypothetical protein L6R39_003729 [Caloplaca ligustica]